MNLILLSMATWLEVHAGEHGSWNELAYASQRWDLLPSHSRKVLGPLDLVRALTPVELLDAWYYVGGGYWAPPVSATFDPTRGGQTFWIGPAGQTNN